MQHHSRRRRCRVFIIFILASPCSPSLSHRDKQSERTQIPTRDSAKSAHCRRIPKAICEVLDFSILSPHCFLTTSNACFSSVFLLIRCTFPSYLSFFFSLSLSLPTVLPTSEHMKINLNFTKSAPSSVNNQ